MLIRADWIPFAMIEGIFYMKLIPLTKGQFAQVDDSDYEWLMQWKWGCLMSKGCQYAIREQYLGGGRKNRKRRKVWMHRLILGLCDDTGLNLSKLEGEHIDHNGFNNQRTNLRAATRKENMRGNYIQS